MRSPVPKSKEQNGTDINKSAQIQVINVDTSPEKDNVNTVLNSYP